MSDLTDQLSKLLDDAGDKNYDPRMEELMRSDRLIDPKYENLSVLEDPEIFHISKIRGAQKAFNIPVWKLKKLYDAEDMKDYHAPWIDYIRDLDPKNENDKKELESNVGDFVIVNEMVKQLVILRPALEGKRASLYADSIKPQVTNNPGIPTQPAEQQEGFLGKMFSFIFGKKDQDNNRNTGRR